MTRKTALLASAALSITAVAACNVILGTPDPTLREPADAAVTDGSAADAAIDAPADAACGTAAGFDASGDPSNCGAPCHSCLGGACVAGKCQPLVISGVPTSDFGLKSLYGMVGVGDTLYGTNWYGPHSVVWRTPKNRVITSPEEIYPAPSSGIAARAAANAIASDGTYIFFAVYRDDNNWQQGIYRLDLQGKGQKISASNGAVNVAVDGTYVYFTDAATSLHVINKTGGFVADIPTGTGGALLALAPGRVVFGRSGAVLVGTPPDAADAKTISGAFKASMMRVDGAYAYFYDAALKHFYRAPLDGSSAAEDITPSGFEAKYNTGSLAVGGGYVYYFDSLVYTTYASSLIRFRAEPPRTIEPLFAFPNDATGGGCQLDPDAIYFTTYGNDTTGQPPYSAVWKLAL